MIACVRVLAETVAHLPFVLYQRDGDDGRRRANEHPLYRLLQIAPNGWQTPFEFREMMMGHVLLRGNAYAYKNVDRAGTVVELIPLNPTRVEAKHGQNGVVYEFRDKTGQKTTFPAEFIFHLKGYASDGLTGVSPIAEAREAVGLAVAAEEFGARSFANDAQPAGVLEHPAKLGEEALSNLRDSIKANHAGVQNARKYMILEEGMKWTKIGMTPNDTQFIETRKFQIEEIARIFRVPPHLIGHLERATFSNIEHQGLEFVTHTILPWLRRWEQAINARLMTPRESETYYCEFLVDALLRGDISTRYSAYATGRQWGWLSVNDIRKRENMDLIDEGDQYLVPLNMSSAGDLPSSENVPNTDESEQNSVRNTDLTPIIDATFERLEERVKRSGKHFSNHRDVILANLRPILEVISSTRGVKICENRLFGDALTADFDSKTGLGGLKTLIYDARSKVGE